MSIGGDLSVTCTSNLGTLNQIICSTSSGVPVNGSATGYRSDGTKLILYPSFSYYMNDYAIGVETNNTFFTVADASVNGF